MKIVELSFCVVKCGVLQGPILGALLFLLYVSDLKNASSVLYPIILQMTPTVFIPIQTYKSYFQQ